MYGYNGRLTGVVGDLLAVEGDVKVAADKHLESENTHTHTYFRPQSSQAL